MPGFGIANSRLGKLNAFQEQKRNVAELANVNNPVPEKIAYVDRPKAVQEQTASLAGAAGNPNPSLDKMTWKNTGIVPMAGQGQYRTEALRDMNEAEFAQNQEKMNATGKEYWIEQIKKDPLNSYAYMNYMLAEDETPEEKRKRERREALGETFRGLGNLIGNAANLYYTHRGGQYIDLNSVNEKHRERMQRIKDKQDALDEQRKQMLIRAKMGDIQAARAEAAKKEQWEREDNIRKENNAYRDKKDKQTQDNWNKQFEWNVKQAEQAAAEREEERIYRRKLDELNNKFRWAQFSWQKEKENAKNSNSSSSRSSSNGKTKMAVVDTPNGVMDVDFGRINQTTYNQLYNKVSDEIKNKYAFDDLDDDKSKQDKMGQAISEALMSQKGYSDWLVKAGVGTYQQQQQQQSTNWNDYIYTPTNWDGYKANQQSEKPVNESAKVVEEITPQSEPANNQVQPVNKYQAMIEGFKSEKAYNDEVEARKAAKKKKEAEKELADAEAERDRIIAELNSLKSPDIDSLVKDNNLTFGQELKLRREAAADTRKRNELKIRLERLQEFIRERKS